MSRRSIPISDGDASTTADPAAAASVPAVVDDAAAEPEIVEASDAAKAASDEPAVDTAEAAASEAPDQGEPTPPPLDPLVKALIGENERMRKALDEKDATLQRYIAAHKKSEAEFAKVRARIEADLDRRVDLARGELIGKLFPVLDDLERSLDSARKTPAFDALVQGVDMVYKTFQSRLEDLGVTRYSPQGEAFDPSLHEAMGVLPAPTAEQNNTVLQVYQPGYRAGEQVLRPARVMVGKFGG